MKRLVPILASFNEHGEIESISFKLEGFTKEETHEILFNGLFLEDDEDIKTSCVAQKP